MGSGPLFVALAAALVGGTGLLVAATLRFPDLPRLVLGAYVVAFTEVVGVVLLLSPFSAVTRPAILAATAVAFTASVAWWARSGCPRPLVRLAHLRGITREHPLLALAIVTGGALLYSFALIVGTPPTSWDALTYHLTRAAFWSQADRVGLVANAYDARVNANPPGAEIVLTFVLEVGRDERLTGFVQFAAVLAVAVGVYALARRIGLSRAEGAFGGLLFLTLPVVLLQSSTAQNDLVLASLLMTATVFLVGDSRRDVVLAGLATALAVSTKVPALYGIPILCGLAFVAPPRRLLAQRLSALLLGLLAGSYWYVVNTVRTGQPLGDLSERSTVAAVFEPAQNFFAAFARAVDAIDLSGANGRDALVYVAVAAGTGILVALLGRRGGRSSIEGLTTGALILVPLALLPVSYLLWSGFAELHQRFDEPARRLPVKDWDYPIVASDALSWFGPIGLVFVVGTAVAGGILVRRRSLPALAIVVCSAPLVTFLLFGVTLAYDAWQGRLFMFSVALSAALWGLVLRVRPYAIAAAAVAATTAVLSLVHYREKPSGIAFFEPSVPQSIWRDERWQSQSRTRPAAAPFLRYLDEEVPPDETLAVAAGRDDFVFPAFGPNLARKVVLVPADLPEPNAGEAEWLAVSPHRELVPDPGCWRLLHGQERRWRVFRRTPCRPTGP